MTWLGKLVSAVILFFSSIVGTSTASTLVPVDTLRTARPVQTTEVLIASTGEKHSEKKQNVVHPVAVISPPVHATELPVCASKTATNCRMVEGISNVAPTTSPKGCSGTGSVELQSPMNIEDIGVVIPMGEMVGGHVTPIDHIYLQPTVFQSAPDTYNVYADASGIIRGIGVESANPENKHTKIRLTIYHTCDFYSIYNLLTSLSPRLQGITGNLGPGQYYNEPISVQQGEVMGKIGGQTLDLSVNYDRVTLKGFIVPEHYASESWKIHTVDPFDYFREPFRSQLLAKDIRQAEPRGGKIDYDIDGRLVGNWFAVGRDGDTGSKDPYGYWKSQLSFVYDWVDPATILISIGNYGDIATLHNNTDLQYAVKGNAPDPKDVSVASGLVKYELVGWSYATGAGAVWDRMSYQSGLHAVNQSTARGTVLVQMISERKIKFQAFPGKTASEVSGFTQAALMYER